MSNIDTYGPLTRPSGVVGVCDHLPGVEAEQLHHELVPEPSIFKDDALRRDGRGVDRLQRHV